MAKTYFPHDSNARNSKKLLRLRKKHGAAGYGVYFMLIERLTEEQGFASDLDYDMLAYDLHVKKELLRSVVENFELFEIKTDEDGLKKFQSAGLLERMEIRGIRSEAGKKGAAARWNNGPQHPVEPTMAVQNDIANDGKMIAKDLLAISKEIANDKGVNSIKENNIIVDKKNNNPFFYSFPFFFDKTSGKQIDLCTLSYLILERNMTNAKEELEQLIAYNNVKGNNWERMTAEQRVSAAVLWKPRTAKARTIIITKNFCSFWKEMLYKALLLNAETEIIYQMLLNAEIEGGVVNKEFNLHTTSQVYEWMENHTDYIKPIVKKLLADFRCTSFNYILTDKQETV